MIGGYGSGWQGSSAPTVESLRKQKLDLADLERLGLQVEGDQVSVASALVELKWNGLRIRYWASNSEYADELVPFVPAGRDVAVNGPGPDHILRRVTVIRDALDATEFLDQAEDSGNIVRLEGFERRTLGRQLRGCGRKSVTGLFAHDCLPYNSTCTAYRTKYGHIGQRG